MMDRGNLIVLTPKKWQIPKFSSWVMTQQNLRKSKRSSAKKTEKNVERYRFWRKAFNNLVNVYGCNDVFFDILGKEFPRQSEFHCECYRSHLEENVRHHSKIGGRTRRDQQCGQDSLGKTFMETSVIDW